MIRFLFMMLLCSFVLMSVSCSKRERSDPDAEEWETIQILADDAEVELSVPTKSAVTASKGDFDEFIQRLEQMKSVERESGQTLLVGESLIFDHDQRFVRMDKNVVVTDDQGILETQRLIGRFSAANEVEYIEAQDGVTIQSEGRKARADQAIYTYQNGFIQLEGKASIFEEKNKLSGERIQFWIKGTRKIICEPNALLEISSASGLNLDGVSDGVSGDTEIRADSAVYDESEHLAVLTGNVRIRDSRAALNCEKVQLFLKEDNEIDWIEASSEVIIQSDDRKALADRATYHANEGKFTLEGDPKVKLGLNIMTGDRIMFWNESRRMVCEPNARILLHVDDETKAKFLKDLND